MEIVRRVVLLAGVLAAAALVVWPTQSVWRVGRVDFAKLQKQKIKWFDQGVKTVAKEAGLEETPKIDSGQEGPLEHFIAKETHGRLHEVSGPAWAKFFADVDATLSGQQRTLARYLEDDSNPNHLYFPLIEEPLASLRDRIGDHQPFAYLKLAGGGGEPRHLAVTFERSGAAMRYAPNFIAFPGRGQAVWVFLATLAVYCFLPRHRPKPEEIRYHQVSAAIVPDWLGMVLATMFFVLPILIIASNASSSRPWGLLDFSDGWGVLTLVMWFMALGGIAIVVVAAWYATFSLFVLEDRLRRVTLTGQAEYRYAEMESAEPASLALPTWLRWTMIGAGLLNWRMMGTMILGATSSLNGMRIRCRDGRTVNIWFDHLEQPGAILGALQAHGVTIAPELLEGESERDDEPRPRPSAKRGLWRAAIWFVVVGGAALALAFWPRAERTVVPPAPEISPEVHAKQELILSEMRKLQPQLKAASEAVGKADPAARPEALRAYQALMARFQELHRQYEELDKVKYVPSTNP